MEATLQIEPVILRSNPFAVHIQQETTELQFGNHIEMGWAEQDVFIEAEAGMVKRVNGNAPLWSVGQFLHTAGEAPIRNPFQDEVQGSFIKGESLGITLGDWLAATGSGTYTVEDDDAYLDLAFERLVPNGVYSLGYWRVDFLPQGGIIEVPAAEAPVFQANTDGSAWLELAAERLPESTTQSASVIVLIYHSDGNETVPVVSHGQYGRNRHVQLMAFVG
jgi:hypothetical protein